MNELEKKIIEVMQAEQVECIFSFGLIKEFISKCSLSDFEKLKDMEWDISNETETPKQRYGNSNELIKKGQILLPDYTHERNIDTGYIEKRFRAHKDCKPN